MKEPAPWASTLMLVMLTGSIFLGTLYLTVGFDRPPPQPATGGATPFVLDFSGMPTAQPFPSQVMLVVPTPTHKPAVSTPDPSPPVLTCPDDPSVLPNGTICYGAPTEVPTAEPTRMPSCTSPPTLSVTCIVRRNP